MLLLHCKQTRIIAMPNKATKHSPLKDLDIPPNFTLRLSPEDMLKLHELSVKWDMKPTHVLRGLLKIAHEDEGKPI